MANSEHVAIVKQGTEILNQWREENPHVKLDLRKATLDDANLRSADLSYADIRNANLSYANLSYAYLSYANLSYANLREANLSYANLNTTDLSYANLIAAKFISANLHSTKLISAKLISADLSAAYLRSAYLRSANLIAANLRSADLRSADLIFAALISANLNRADLTSADLRSAKLNAANLSEANLTAIQASHTNFERATFTGACIKDWQIDRQTNLKNIKTEYIFLDIDEHSNTYLERRPISGMFVHGDFANLVQQSTRTIELIFRNGINWEAFAHACQMVKNHSDVDGLYLQGMENKEDGAFIIRFNVAPDADKAKIQKFVMEEYMKSLKAIAFKYLAKRAENNSQIKVYLEQLKLQHHANVDLRKIVKTMAEKESSKRDLKGAKGAEEYADSVQKVQVNGNWPITMHDKNNP